MASPSALRAALQPSRAACQLVPLRSRAPFGAPILLRPWHQSAGLSTSPTVLARTRKPTRRHNQGKHRYEGARTFRDNNPRRGESALRGTGLRWPVSVSRDPLPQPVKAEEMPLVETSPTHGLWDFFYDRDRVAQPPIDDAAHGRGWAVIELRNKSWEDLHRLWWVCVKERNRIATARWERRKSSLGHGDAEAMARGTQVKATMKSIRFVLTERYYNWEDALELAKKDPEIMFNKRGGVYYERPPYVEEADEGEGEGEGAVVPSPKDFALSEPREVTKVTKVDAAKEVPIPAP